ncbi:MAG: hypothetical protein E7513_03440 [Ruminococcaceae bacterium]|nr:hypothetical protein [Oscillospiraceae bacterium]
MKKLLALILTLLMCMTLLTACKDESYTLNIDNLSDITPADSECSELEIRQLMEKNLDCYYMFYVAPIAATDEELEKGYYKAETTFFEDYEDFYDFVTDTYIIEKARELLKYPDKDKPLYKDIDGTLCVNPKAANPTQYEVMWDDSYTVEFTDNSTTQCSFILTTTDFESNEYVARGNAVCQDDEWVLVDIVF